MKFAVYGALAGGDPTKSMARDVSANLQTALDNLEPPRLVKISNDTLGGDPAKNSLKHFAAIVTVDGVDVPFACQENQTIDFG
ncbi:hypothetical protein EBO15_38420 [Actinomadura harenae]|uniref:Uncharacterized protein n=1 Tax=Actinomadura harenae TaxID=2483351 RepID=A0A3M2LGE8_9ACTN|nr:hypothetical protein EBO15_38420 [Actinomadura harenae]